jgi:xanthine/CO dehydrogenase XdhC/CoxF family maturation factor
MSDRSVRQQPWSDDDVHHGRILVLTDNPISRSIAVIATTAGRTVVVEPADDGGPGLDPQPGDAVVLCDHDAPDAPTVLRSALASDASYVAMMASRGRAAGLLAELAAEGVDVSEIVAESYGRAGGPMRG